MNSSEQPPSCDGPGQQGGDADQHGEGVVVEVAGLQPYDLAGDVADTVAETFDDSLVDQPVVKAVPDRLAQPDRRLDEDEGVELVEGPAVEEELVEARIGRS